MTKRDEKKELWLDDSVLPTGFADEAALEEFMTRPSRALAADLDATDGDIMILGVGGKMGPTMARLARRAAPGKRVIGVARFSEKGLKEDLESHGVETIAADLMDRAAVEKLPRVKNVIFMAGRKFGASGNQALTWAMNAHVPALVAESFRDSRIVAFSTGCVYPFVPVTGPGANEREPVAFLGEYASTCVGRERVFAHYAQEFGTRQLMYRLNYAVELRYGVLVDIALKVARGEPVDVTMGWLNCIWQGDACARAIQCLEHAANPPRILNITGPEKLGIRGLAEEFGRRLGRPPVLTGTEATTAWLADASESLRLFGPPETSVPRMLDLITAHVSGGGRLLGKPTHFEARNGKF